MRTRRVLFSDTLHIVQKIFQEAIRQEREVFGGDVVAVRNLFGRIRLLLSGSEEGIEEGRREKLRDIAKELSEKLGPYGGDPENMILYRDDIFLGSQPYQEEDLRYLIKMEGSRLWLLERQVTGQDWNPLRSDRPGSPDSPDRSDSSDIPRATLYGIKGGVGRSTATALWAWHLASTGKRVLLFDLDLESPGLSSTLLSPGDQQPDFGIVDWFVEDAVGQADCIADDMILSSPLATPLPGDILVVPAYGSETEEYLPKLSRCYMEALRGSNGQQGANAKEQGRENWAGRLRRLVEHFEAREKPDIALFDSRAGIHDIAAVAVAHLNAKVFLFAANSPQTWRAYSFLFSHWQNLFNALNDLNALRTLELSKELPKSPPMLAIREQLRMVAAMAPETDRAEYLRRFRENSWKLFQDYLYDEIDSDIDGLPFSFDSDDDDAPHSPWPIYWQRSLQEFQPTSGSLHDIGKEVEMALGKFIEQADRWLFEE